MNLSRRKRGQIFYKTNGHCTYCGIILDPFDEWTIDHVVPIKQGGGDDLDNLMPCCRTCNIRKKAKTPEQFRAWMKESVKTRLEKVFNHVLNCWPMLSDIDYDNLLAKINRIEVMFQNADIQFYFENPERIKEQYRRLEVNDYNPGGEKQGQPICDDGQADIRGYPVKLESEGVAGLPSK